MSYCTLEDILLINSEKDIKNITQDDKTQDEINEERVAAAIEYADAIIDDKLKLRYEVPLTTVSKQLQLYAIDIVKYLLYKARYDNEVPKQIHNSYADAMKYLDDCRNGNEIIEGVNKTTGFNFDDAVKVNKTRRNRIYTERLLRKI